MKSQIICLLLVLVSLVAFCTTQQQQKEKHPNTPELWIQIAASQADFSVDLPEPGSIQVVVTQETDGISITSAAQPYQQTHKVILDHLLPETVYRYTVVYRRIPGDQSEVIKTGKLVTTREEWSYTVKD